MKARREHAEEGIYESVYDSIYDSKKIEDMLDEDELSPQEEAFMRGYMDEEEEEYRVETEEVEE